MPAPDLVVFGNLLLDDVVFPDGRCAMAQPGGAVLYFSLGAALWGKRVGIVSVRGTDYPDETLTALAARGVDLSGLRPLGGPSLRTWLLYEGRVRRVVHRLEGPSFAEVSPLPSDLPRAWRGAGVYHMAPLPAERQRALVEDLASQSRGVLSLDPYLLLTEETWAEASALARSVDLFFLSEDEFLVPHDHEHPPKALDKLWGGRLRCLALKQGERGGWLGDRDGWHRWPTRATPVVDVTGAGDAFAAGFLAATLDGEPADRAAKRGVVTASFAIAGWGIDALVRVTPATARARLAQWFPR